MNRLLIALLVFVLGACQSTTPSPTPVIANEGCTTEVPLQAVNPILIQGATAVIVSETEDMRFHHPDGGPNHIDILFGSVQPYEYNDDGTLNFGWNNVCNPDGWGVSVLINDQQKFLPHGLEFGSADGIRLFYVEILPDSNQTKIWLLPNVRGERL